MFALVTGVQTCALPISTSLLRPMADVGPNHPTTRSFSAAYWRGGDASLESHIFRSQYYDKLVVWGGDAAVRHAMKYAAPGFEIVSFDPKVSISLVGREAFQSPETITAAAARSEEHTSELQSLMRISYAVFCLKKKNMTHKTTTRSTAA